MEPLGQIKIDTVSKPTETLSVLEKRNLLEKWIPTLDGVSKKELYEVIKTYNIPFTKNRNGLFINLAYLEENYIDILYSQCKFFKNSLQLTEETRSLEKKENVPNTFSVVDQSLMQECVRDVIKDSLSLSLQEKLNKKLSVFAKESNWKHQPIPNTHSKNAELGKVRGRISRRKNDLLKRCRDISLYLSKNENSVKEQDILSGTNELSVDQ